MGGFAEDDETKSTAAVADAAAIAQKWQSRSTMIAVIQQRLSGLKIDGEGPFNTSANALITETSAGLTTISEAWGEAASHANDQVIANQFGAARLLNSTTELNNAKEAAQTWRTMAAQFPDNAQIAANSKAADAAETAARQARLDGLRTWYDETDVNTKSLPSKVTTMEGAASKIESSGVNESASTSPASTQPTTSMPQVITPKSGNPSSPSTTPSKPEQPAKTTKPEDNKSADPSSQNPSVQPNQGTPQQQPTAQQGQQPQQGQPAGAVSGSGGQPQQGQGAARPTATPISTPTPTPVGNGNNKGGGIRPASTLPPRSTPSGPLGSGAGAKPSAPSATIGTGANSAANNGSGGRGGGSGAGTGTGSSSARPGGGMMGGGMGGGAGHGGQNGSVRQRAEIKDSGRQGDLQGRRAEEAATGGVGDEPLGPPTPLPDRSAYAMPQVPNVTAPVPPTPPTPPTAPTPPSR